MRKMLPLMVMAIVLMAIIVPALAGDTSVTVTNAGTSKIWVKAKWEALGLNGQTDKPAACNTCGFDNCVCPIKCPDMLYINPPAGCNEPITVGYFAVVYTSAGDPNYIKDVFANVQMPPDCTNKKIELYNVDLMGHSATVGNRVLDSATAVNMLNAAAANKLVTFGVDDTGHQFTLQEVRDEILQNEAFLFYNTEPLSSCESSAGFYHVTVGAADWANIYSADLVTDPSNFFYWAPSTADACMFDFTGVNYGQVPIGVHTWRGGDYSFSTPTLPTAGNCGNVPQAVRVLQNDMNLGQTSTMDVIFGLWNVKYDIRVVPANVNPQDVPETYYSPYQTVSAADSLQRCDVDKVDFSIKIREARAQTYTGTIDASCIPDVSPQFCDLPTCSWEAGGWYFRSVVYKLV
jgi:hypothetical protein